MLLLAVVLLLPTRVLLLMLWVVLLGLVTVIVPIIGALVLTLRLASGETTRVLLLLLALVVLIVLSLLSTFLSPLVPINCRVLVRAILRLFFVVPANRLVTAGPPKRVHVRLQ
jgi:hypothetical protein